MELLVALALLCLVLAVLLFRHSRRSREALRLPQGTLVYQDTAEQPGTLLVSHTHRLKGKPDFLIRTATHIIPVEAKTGRTPRAPYEGHILQLLAYCLLVEAAYGTRPPYGILRYPDRDFEIPFTPAREQHLLNVLAEMQQARDAPTLHRSHTHPARCKACGYRTRCDEALTPPTS